MENNQHEEQYIQKLRSRIFSEPSTLDLRPDLVEYVKYLGERAETLSKHERLGYLGHGIAMDITGAIAFQGADGKVDDEWEINADTEPELWEILSISGRLDANPDSDEAWAELLPAIRKLR